MKKLVSAFIALVFCGIGSVHADEGMWLPLYIKRLNHADMQKCGLQLTAEEIYSVNQASLKDAIVVLNGGSCTAEMISDQGLMLTNHHCGYGVIQSHSSEADDLLSNGFWAMTKGEEKPAEDMTAGFLVRMEDVTSKVLANLSDAMSEDDRNNVIRENIGKIEEEAIGDTHYEARVKSFFDGNEYYLFIYEVFRDVRLVGAPPSSVGKYGGDTDNWMWPRHTGDFCMLRVYSGPDGKPADYSEENIPLKPRHHLPVSLEGVEKGDYAMIMGYPGSTDRYLTSYGVKLAVDKEQPAIVHIREKRLQLMKEDMDASDAIRIKYASKYARVSNYYKYFKGQTRGLKRLKVYDKKKAEEDAFVKWVNADAKRKEKYGSVISDFESAYKDLNEYRLAQVYLNEAFFGIESVIMSWRTAALKRALDADEPNQEAIDAAVAQLRDRAKGYFKDYNSATDKKVFAALLEMFTEETPVGQHPSMLDEVKKKYKGDWNKYADAVWKKSIFVDEARFNAFLDNPSAKTLDKDPIYSLMKGGLNEYRGGIAQQLHSANESMSRAQRLFAAGLREMNPSKKYYPNANSTMRITYGNVKDYYPRDAVFYKHYTTLAGVIEKHDPDNPEFVLPAKLIKLYEKKDYGRYGQDGELRVNFITNNDITGGNSGSPVINGKGHLIGCAFDGNWEAMSGDIAFENELQRTIAVDARYILFIVDKYAGAGHLVDEMTLVDGSKDKASNEVPADSMDKPGEGKAEATPTKMAK